MEIKILEDRDNKMFNRREIKASASLEKTPSREEIIKILSEKFKVPEENIKIKGIHGNFGVKEFTIEANLYNSKEDKEALELKKKKEAETEKRAAEAKQAAEAPKEPTQESPQEESKPQEEAPQPEQESEEKPNEEKTEEKKEEVKE